MATLHGILAELGIADPDMHPEREAQGMARWSVGEDFRPEQGGSYEVAYGRIPFRGEERQVIKRIRIDGPTADSWFDLEENHPLDRALHSAPVKAFRPLE